MTIREKLDEVVREVDLWVEELIEEKALKGSETLGFMDGVEKTIYDVVIPLLEEHAKDVLEKEI